jgi:dTDP-4-dehydrorhamnose reductase
MLRDRLPLLITGITGVAGFNAFHFFQARYPGQVIGLRPRQTWRLQGPGIIPLASEDVQGMRQLFDQHGFRSVLNCVGNCALKSCELDPAMARRINVVSAQVLVEVAQRHDCRLVHLSSDLVFSGTGLGHHVETDPVDPVTIYGKTMVQAEEVFLTALPRTAILRISLPMGPSFNHHAGAIDWIQSRFRAHRPATLYFDEVRSCTYCDDLNHVFERLLASNDAGLFHAGGPRPITLYEIAQVVNRVGGYHPDLLKGCPRLDAGPMPPRAGNVSMNSGKLVRALGYQPFQSWPLGEDLHPTDRQWHYQRAADKPGSLEQIETRLYKYPTDTQVACG